MTQEFSIEGMTCQNCVAGVKKKLSRLNGIKEAKVSLNFPQLVLETTKEFQFSSVKSALNSYVVSELKSENIGQQETKESALTIRTYLPLILIAVFLLGVCFLAQFPFENLNGKLFMRHFMGGFFLTFSFFKLLDLKGFALAYQKYDIVAGKWANWGLIYPFFEVLLGVLYLTNMFPFATNIGTILLLGIGTIGVLRSVLSSNQIQCACLGSVFNLPMTTVTFVENGIMILMASTMIIAA